MSQLYKEGNRLRLVLNKRERKTLTHILNRSNKPYKRERAATLLKVSDGMSPHAVAVGGLLKRRDPDTVYNWVKAFSKNGLKGLEHKKRNHRDSLSTAEKKQLEQIIVTKSPRDFSLNRSRWTLKTLQMSVPFLKSSYRSLSGIWYLLRRNRINYKRSRDFLPSPDPRKEEKIRRMRAILGLARRKKDEVVFLLLDEFSFYRQPLNGPAWWPVGRRKQPKAYRSPENDTRGRVIGALNSVTGELTYKIASRISVPCFCAFLRHIKEVYSEASVIYVALDNWYTVHKHQRAFETFAETGIIPVWLPTYSPQSNPIELLWGNLNDEVLRLHGESDDFYTLKERVMNWLDVFSQPSQRAIEMVGLTAKPAIRTKPD